MKRRTTVALLARAIGLVPVGCGRRTPRGLHRFLKIGI